MLPTKALTVKCSGKRSLSNDGNLFPGVISCTIRNDRLLVRPSFYPSLSRFIETEPRKDLQEKQHITIK